jgi:hypothetical protein
VEPVAERVLREPEVRRGRVEMAAGAVAEAAVMTAAPAGREEREVARLDPRLQLVALLLRQPPRSHGRVDAIRERLLQCARELCGLHAELLGRVVQHRLAVLRRRSGLRRRDRRPAAGDRQTGDRARDDLPLQPVHVAPLVRGPDEAHPTTGACGGGERFLRAS